MRVPGTSLNPFQYMENEKQCPPFVPICDAIAWGPCRTRISGELPAISVMACFHGSSVHEPPMYFSGLRTRSGSLATWCRASPFGQQYPILTGCDLSGMIRATTPLAGFTIATSPQEASQMLQKKRIFAIGIVF